MDVVVCVKQVPDPATSPQLDPRTLTTERSGPLVIDEADRIGVEVALQLVAHAGGGVVTAVSMAPNSEMAGLREALAMGVERAVLVSDESLAGSDALVTAKVLAAAIARLGADLVVAGTESSDGYTGTMAVQLAELLGLPSVSFARRVAVVAGVLVVERRSAHGLEDVECPLPALVTVSGGAAPPRRPTFAGLLAARTKAVERFGAADLGLDPLAVGRVGARQEVVSVTAAVSRRTTTVVADRGDAHWRVIEVLERAGVL